MSRFSAIYVLGRTGLIQQVQPAMHNKWSNRIHSEDCAALLHGLIEQWRQGRLVHDLYLASDSCAVGSAEFREYITARLVVHQNSDRAECATQRPVGGKDAAMNAC